MAPELARLYHQVYVKREEPIVKEVHGQAQVIIAKQRHGPIGTINLSFTDRITKFGNLIRNDNIPEGF